MAGSDLGPIICQPSDGTVSPGQPKSLAGLARESEEAGGKRPEFFGEARRFSSTAQPVHRRGSGRKGKLGASTGSAGKVAYSSFRPAQQPEHKAADWSRTLGKTLRYGCQRQQDDSKTPKRLVVIPVCDIPLHYRRPLVRAMTIS